MLDTYDPTKEQRMSSPSSLNYIWMNGTLVPQAQAVLPVDSAAVFYATNVFEGLRAYWNDADEELYCFRLEEHFIRLRESMKMMRFTVPYSNDDLYEAVREVLRGNDIHEDIHMHMVAYVLGSGQDVTEPTGLYINPRRRGRMTAPGKGLRCCISSWTRTSDNAIPIRLKCGANYQNARLATLQAKADGYDSPIFLNQQGKVAEGTGASLFMVRKGKLVTPTITNDILESITRSTLIEEICPHLLGLEVVERDIDRTELYVADEAFFCGSGYEITPITSIDRFPLGDGEVGPVTQQVLAAYMNLVRGVDRRYAAWRTPTYHTATV
jgi:branched-chain amino acid aminotransferase